MRLIPVAIVLSAIPALGQNYLDLYPGATTASSRGSLGTDAGASLTGFLSSHWQGVGDNGSKCSTVGFQVYLQDQNAATQESYHVVFRGGSNITGPGTNPTSVLSRLGPLTTPKNNGGGIRAWALTTTFSSAPSLPCQGFFAAGTEMPPAPNWVADGLSTHTSYSNLADQSPAADDTAWEIRSSAIVATHPAHKRSWRHRVLVNNAVLQMGANGKYGNGGMYPKVGSLLTATVRGGTANANALCLLFADALAGSPIPLFPATTRVYLFGVFPTRVSTATLDSAGNGTHLVGPVPSSGPRYVYPFQALMVGTNVNLTNLAGVTIDL